MGVQRVQRDPERVPQGAELGRDGIGFSIPGFPEARHQAFNGLHGIAAPAQGPHHLFDDRSSSFATCCSPSPFAICAASAKEKGSPISARSMRM